MLVDSVHLWAKSAGVSELGLMVTGNNPAATDFYLRYGFRMTGRTEPYPNDPAVVEHEMVLGIG